MVECSFPLTVAESGIQAMCSLSFQRHYLLSEFISWNNLVEHICIYMYIYICTYIYIYINIYIMKSNPIYNYRNKETAIILKTLKTLVTINQLWTF